MREPGQKAGDAIAAGITEPGGGQRGADARQFAARHQYIGMHSLFGEVMATLGRECLHSGMTPALTLLRWVFYRQR
ncbi:hypothetical protein D8B20_14100 [Candidatus Pantoea soli]|uniref:Uncharacterized protein n=1 Tax=Candidatus Pantoea soli TaxID=3098669 RepID=A0A518XFG9_9GAMM|nr:hypothetical protein D8B20_14100 [Pantoea soli]